MRSAVFAAAAVAVLITGGAALSQSAPADPLAPGAGADEAKSAAPDAAKPEKAKKKPAKRKHPAERSIEVTVQNQRSVGLVELQAGPAGASELKKVAGPLAFGRKTVVHLKRAKDCLYDIHAHFADEADTDQSGVDLCKDKAINLTD
jgi:hypothetical protein